MPYKLLIIIVLLFFVQISFGQKVKPRPKPTPTIKQDKLTAKQIDELLAKINIFIGEAGQKFKQNNFQTAIQDFEAAIKLVDSAKGQLGGDGKYLKGISLFSIGTAYSKLNEVEKAIATLEKSLLIYGEVKVETEFSALTYQFLGKNYQKQNKHQKSADYFSKSVTEYRKLLAEQTTAETISATKLELAAVLVMTADSMMMMGDKSNALKISIEAQQIFSESNVTLENANALNRIGRINLEIGKVIESVQFFQQALKLVVNAQVEPTDLSTALQIQTVTLNNLGHTYNLLGDKKTSFEYFQKSLKICDANNINEPKPYILNNVGVFLLEQGDYAEAIENFIKAAEISRQTKDERTESLSLNNIGAGFFELGNYQKAADYWEQAAKISVKINDVETSANITANSAGALLELGEVDEALKLVKIAERFYLVTDNRANLAKVYETLSRIFKKKGETEKALIASFEARKIAKEIGSKKTEAGVNLSIASLYKDLKDYENATKFYFSALQTANTINDSVVESSSLLGLSFLADYKKNAPLAILYGKKSINQFQNLRSKNQKLDKETQKIFLENVQIAYQHLADLLIAQGRIAEAEQVLDLLKEAEFYEYVRRDDKVAKELTAKLSLTDNETAAFKRYNEFSENIAAIGKEYAELEAEKKQIMPNQPFTKQSRFDELGKKLKDATEVFLKFLDELKVEFGEENARVAQVDSGLQAMLKEMNATDTVIISTIASAERLNLILTTTSFQKAYTVDITSVDLNKLVADFRKAVQNPNVDPRPLGQKLHNILVKPLAKDLSDSQIKTIVWSLDGTLRYVPVSALWDGNKYLAESYANAVITLASRDKLKDKPSDKTAWQTVGFGVSKSATVEENEAGAFTKRQFEALPSVPEELCKVVSDNESIAKCAEKGIIRGRRFLDEQFTLQEFKNQLGNFPLVHIASHFSLKAGNDKNSYLLLGGGDERRLTIAELNRSNSIFVGVELLTLSACNTAMTGEKKSNGVEIEGFGAIAQKQGAKSVLATLWSVADSSTSDLMNEFYTFLSVQKLSKAESFRQAQIKLIYGKYNADEFAKLRSELAGLVSNDTNQPPFQKDEKRPFAHPFYWSPFVLIGNWQ